MDGDRPSALQYCFCVALGSDAITTGFTKYEQTVSDDQLELARELVRRVIYSSDGNWHDIIGGLREDGSRYVSALAHLPCLALTCSQSGSLEHYLPLLRITTFTEYGDFILKPAAELCDSARKPLEAIKLYNLAGAVETVMACLAAALGDVLGESDGGGNMGRQLEAEADRVLRAADARGVRVQEGDDVRKLMMIRKAMELFSNHDPEGALEVRAVSLSTPLPDHQPFSPLRRLTSLHWMPTWLQRQGRSTSSRP